jgi:hypothetical protein
MGIEDDGPSPPHALKVLLSVYSTYSYAGLVSGVEIGRHGLPHIGLWTLDDVYEPTVIKSLLPDKGITEIDASSLFCYLKRAENFKKHHFEPDGEQLLGPDVSYCLALRTQGFKNYAAWNVTVDHLRSDGPSLTLANTDVAQVKLTKTASHWRQEVLEDTAIAQNDVR